MELACKVSGAQALHYVGSPAIRNDGKIIIGDSAGPLWQINAFTRLLVAGWPSLQGGNARRGVGVPATTLIEELNPMGNEGARTSIRTLGDRQSPPWRKSGPYGWLSRSYCPLIPG